MLSGGLFLITDYVHFYVTLQVKQCRVNSSEKVTLDFEAFLSDQISFCYKSASILLFLKHFYFLP
jgi:hypothetical protein